MKRLMYAAAVVAALGEPEDALARQVDSEFTPGPHLLVAPVLNN